MTLFDTLGPFLLCLALLWPLGEMRKWLYQHIFKVGWLLTKNLQTATVLFYTFFLPGVLLHEFVRWLTAGVLNVRADRAIAWPETQQIAELKLNFVKVGRSTGAFNMAIIEAAPFTVSLLIIWLIAQNTLGISAFTDTLKTQGMRGVGAALGQLLSVPDVYLWLYILFAIGNTMLPRWSALRGARILLVIPAVMFVALIVLGVADEAVRNGLFVPFNQALNLVSGVFVTVIGVNALMTAALGSVESIIERVTGDSATFEKGKLIARTRAEVQALRRQEAERQSRERAAARERAQAPAVAGGPPSIYRIALPTPGAPGREPVPTSEGVVVRRDESRGLGAGTPAPPPLRPVLPQLAADSDQDTRRSSPVPPPPPPAFFGGVSAPVPTGPSTAPPPGSGAPRTPVIVPPGGTRPAHEPAPLVSPRAEDKNKEEMPDDRALPNANDDEVDDDTVNRKLDLADDELEDEDDAEKR